MHLEKYITLAKPHIVMHSTHNSCNRLNFLCVSIYNRKNYTDKNTINITN